MHLPEITTPTELYNYYKGLYDADIAYAITKDLKRTCLGNEDFKLDHLQGQNPLYNVLNAYAHYDPSIGYCQGMNFIVALLLHVLENEEDSFYCFVHVMKTHGWRGCYDGTTSKLISFLDFLQCVLETAYSDVYQHVQFEIDESLVPVFASNIQTIFIRDCPNQIATHIFEVFLLDGEQVIFTLLVKMIELQEQTILKILGHDLLVYMQSIMPYESLRLYPMMTLLD